jgi:hypothetical protein
LTDFEVIISDNASTDDTQAICHRYVARDSRIRYYRQERNVGATRNYNYAFEHARGEYFRWHAHDDVCAPDFLRLCVDALDSDPQAVSCHTQKAMIDEQGRLLVDLAKPPSQHEAGLQNATIRYDARFEAGRRSAAAHERYRSVLLGPAYCLECYGLMRTSALQETRLHLPFYGSEKILAAELALLGTHVTVDQTLFFVRIVPRRSLADQQENIGQMKPRRFTLTRFRLLRGHAGAIWQVPLSAWQRARCFCALGQYVLQVRQWKRVLTEMLSGAPVESRKSHTWGLPPAPVTLRQLFAVSKSNSA